MIVGRCLCRAVTITVRDPHERAVGVCHCRMCQAWSGALFASFEAPAAAVSVEGPVAVHASSAFTERAFCPACGSHLFLRQTDGGDGYELFPGLFPDAADWPLRSEIYTDLAPRYARLAATPPRRETMAEYEAHNPHLEGDDR